MYIALGSNWRIDGSHHDREGAFSSNPQNSGDIVNVNVHLLLATGDIPAVKAIINHAGHMSYSGCQICRIAGERPEGGSGMYFVPGENDATWCTVEGFQTGNEYVE